MTAKRRDRSGQHRFDSLPLTDLSTDVARDSIVRRPTHEAQCFTHPILRKQIQERRLTEMNCERLFECAVEDRLTSCVDEISDQDRIARR